jgi:hypothetical protein
MAFQIRRGTNAQRLTLTLAEGEPFWTTDTDSYFVGDGSTAGGNAVTGAFEAHNIASHSDTTATGAELETLTDGSNADSLHTHAASSPVEDTIYSSGWNGDTTHSPSQNAVYDKINTMDILISGNTYKELGGLGDVVIDTPANYEVLSYKAVGDQWINRTAAEAGFATLGGALTVRRVVYTNESGNLQTSATVTDTEVDYLNGATSNIQDQIDANVSGIAVNTAASHAESHTVVSHSDTTATGTELNTLTGSGDTSLHYHTADRARANHTGTQDLTTIVTNNVDTPVYTTLNDYINTQSSSIISGCLLTDAGSGNIDIAAGTAYLKTTDSDIGQLVSIDFTGRSGLNIADDGIPHYIYLDYNAGTPIASGTTNIFDLDLHTTIPIGTAHRINGNVHVTNIPANYNDIAMKSAFRLFELYGRKRASGMITAESGNRYLTISAGVLYFAHHRITTAAMDTTGADTFEHWYNDGVWQHSSQSVIDNLQYNDYGTGLATLSNNQYGIHWAYLHDDGECHIVYGQASNTLVEATEAQLPVNLPTSVTGGGVLIAKIIVEKSVTNLYSIGFPWSIDIQSTPVTVHNNLGGLNSGDYQHLTAAEYANVHAESHTVASHSDTTATGTELETLTDGSNADSLHTHRGSKSFTIKTPAAADDMEAFFHDRAYTISKVIVRVQGGTNVVWNLKHNTSYTAGNDVFGSNNTTTSGTSYGTLASFSDATVPADSALWVDLVSTSGDPTWIHITIFYEDD